MMGADDVSQLELKHRAVENISPQNEGHLEPHQSNKMVALLGVRLVSRNAYAKSGTLLFPSPQGPEMSVQRSLPCIHAERH